MVAVVNDNDETESQRLPLDQRSGAGVRMSRNSYLGAQPQSSHPLGVQPVHRHSAHPVHNAQCTTIILLTTRCTARCTNTRQGTQHHSLVPAIWGLHSAQLQSSQMDAGCSAHKMEVRNYTAVHYNKILS